MSYNHVCAYDVCVSPLCSNFFMAYLLLAKFSIAIHLLIPLIHCGIEIIYFNSKIISSCLNPLNVIQKTHVEFKNLLIFFIKNNLSSLYIEIFFRYLYSNSKESNIFFFFFFSCKCDVFLIEFHNIFKIVMLSVTKGKTLLNFLEWERNELKEWRENWMKILFNRWA